MEYFLPDPFLAYLKDLPPPALQSPEKHYAGYKVKHSSPKLSPEEQKQREDTAYHVLSEAMRKPKKRE